MASTIGLNKVFILDKYFAELNKYWQNECLHQQEKPKYNFNQFQQSQQQQHHKSIDNNRKSIENQAIVTDNINDLIHLEAPITEDSLIRSLHTRFLSNEYFTNIGPVLIALNPYNDTNNALTLDSVHHNDNCYPLYRIVHEAVRQQTETGYPQVIILSGISGSGKTYSSMTILRQLFNLIGGGAETDSFKHLAAAFTVLRSLGTASVMDNAESSRIGNFIEIQITDGAIYRTKIHCYFLDQTRVVRLRNGNECNYHIFYQMLYGLSMNEKTKLYLDGYDVEHFRYLRSNDHQSLNSRFHSQTMLQNHSNRFDAWKSCLSVLGIPFMDVARILAAILLLGNVCFDNENSIMDHPEKNELHAVASLLGIATAQLYKGLTQRTLSVPNGQHMSINMQNVHSFHWAKDCLAKALYARTVSTIIRRANSSKRLITTTSTTSSESAESASQTMNQQFETSSSHHAASSIGSACGKSYKSMAILQNVVQKSSIEGFIGILDMFGFEDGHPSRLEQLCINLCAETMQHFYNTHIFKSSIESCREEGIQPALEIDYVDNVPCIDLISSLRTGLFSLIDHESFNGGTTESLLARQQSIHGSNNRYVNMTDQTASFDGRFGIRHYHDNVVYDASDFIETNSDYLSDDIVAMFHKSLCSFGFASHLFSQELRQLSKNRNLNLRRSVFRISPTTNVPSDSNDSSSTTTFSQDFHNRLDNLLRILVHARPHFIRCIKINTTEQSNQFDRSTIMKQIRSLQILETVNLMAEGLPHRMRFKAFINRYRLLVNSNELKMKDDSLISDCNRILDRFDRIHAVNSLNTNRATAALTSWTLGRKHVFLSESARQQLEIARNGRRNSAATMIQSLWRGHRLRRRQWPLIVQQRQQLKFRSRPQPISLNAPQLDSPLNHSRSIAMYDFNLIKETCLLLGIDPDVPPQLPPSRTYTVSNNLKYYFPQTRSLITDFIDPLNHIKIQKGQSVIVLGFSPYKRGCFTVEYSKGLRFELPQHLVELQQNFLR